MTPRLASHLHRSRHGIFHFRFVLPPALAAIAGQKEVWRTLRTRDPERAKLLAYLLNARLAMMKKPSLEDILKLSPDDIQQLTINGLQVGAFKAARIELDGSTPETFRRDQEALKDLIATFGNIPPPLPLTPADAEASAAEAAELAAIRRAGLSKPLDECVRLYLGSKAGEISPASTKDYANALGLFVRWADGATPIGFCDWDLVRGYFEFLQWLPTNYEKRRKKDFGDHDAKVFVAAAKARNERPVDVVSVQTRKQQQRVLNGFFEWTREAGLLTGANPAAAQVKLSKAQQTKINAGRGYLPFSTSELQTIFDPKHFLTFAQTPEDFFLPLLALYTGARMNELAQARLKDLRRAGDRWYLDIQPDHTGDDATETRVKTVSSGRSAPLHNALIQLGFFGYAEELRERGALRLFPHLARDAKGKHTKNPSRRFGVYLTGLGIKDSRRKAFPSFRITLIQRLKASGVAKDARMEMVGHAPRDVHDGTYAGQFEDEFLAAQTLDVTRFDELDHDGLAVDLPARLAHFVTMAVGQQRTSLKTLSG